MSDSKSLVTRIASRFGVDGGKFYETLKATAFRQQDGGAPSNEQMMTLLIVADQYKLNPFTGELYAFPDRRNGIVPVVGVNGWCRIINEHPHCDGVEFVYAEKMVRMPHARVDCPEWIECVIHRKDRSHPVRVKEFLDEVYRAPFQGKGRDGAYRVDGPWQTHTKRQLRHKALIQCSRVSFGFSGIYDQDEIERIRETERGFFPAPGDDGSPPASRNDDPELEAVAHRALDPILNKLACRAIAENAWSAAHEYVKERYAGAAREYAVRFLQEKELERIEPPRSDVRAAADPADESPARNGKEGYRQRVVFEHPNREESDENRQSAATR